MRQTGGTYAVTASSGSTTRKRSRPLWRIFKLPTSGLKRPKSPRPRMCSGTFGDICIRTGPRLRDTAGGAGDRPSDRRDYNRLGRHVPLTAAACSMGAPTAPGATSVRRSAAAARSPGKRAEPALLARPSSDSAPPSTMSEHSYWTVSATWRQRQSIPRPSPCSPPLNTVSRALRSNPSPKRRGSPGRGATRCCAGRRFSCPRPSCIDRIGRSRVKPRLAISPPRAWPAATRSPTRSSAACTKPWSAMPS